MPPAPRTSTVAPSSTRAVLSTAPTPVCTAQPITHAISVGTSRGIGTAPVACVITCSANPPTPRPRYTTSPRRASPVLPSANVLVMISSEFTHSACSLRTHQ